MDAEGYKTVEDLFRHHWDNIALICLSDPKRFVELRNAMGEWAGEPVSDISVSRSVQRLGQANLVRTGTADSPHEYALTVQGRARVALLDNFVLMTAPSARSGGEASATHTTTMEPSDGMELAEPLQGRPNTAEVYDYWLGGSHHSENSRRFAEAVTAAVPQTPLYALANRAFLRRAVEFAAEAGIRQFLDIGSGFPTAGNVHEIAQSCAQDARVVYVDLDPNAVRHGRFMLAGNPRTSMIQGDVSEIDSILDDAAARELIDFGKPVAVLVLALFHFVPGDVSGIIGRLHKVMAPGSFLIISHSTPQYPQAAQHVARGRQEVQLRSATEVKELLAGFDIVGPGVVGVQQWRPAPGDLADLDPAAFVVAVGRRG